MMKCYFSKDVVAGIDADIEVDVEVDVEVDYGNAAAVVLGLQAVVFASASVHVILLVVVAVTVNDTEAVAEAVVHVLDSEMFPV